jgi:IS605 OrfB family transposase
VVVVGALRVMAAPFVAPGPSGVSVRTRLRLTADEEQVLRAVGGHLGALASGDVARRCRDGLRHDKDTWAARKRALTAPSSSRWAGSITKATHDQWALARRGQAAHLKGLDAGIATLTHRLSQPIGAKGSKRAPGGYRSAREWHAKSRRLAALQDRRATLAADAGAGRVRVVRGGKKLANTRHHLEQAELSETRWRGRWEAARMFLRADGESGKRFGNETVRVTSVGVVSIKLPAPLAHEANDGRGRYTLTAPVAFAHRSGQWADRIAENRAVAYTISHDPDRDRWYLTACWQPAPAPQLSVEAALAAGCIGADANDDHLAAWQLDVHGNPVGQPHRFFYDLSGTADHRDAQIRHALTRLLHWARRTGVSAIVIEDLDFTDSKTREKHGRRKRFRQLISRFPTARLRTRLVAMAAEQGIAVVAADPAYTSKWGAQHWLTPLRATHPQTTGHDCASIVIGRRAQGHSARRRTPPPPHHQSDGAGHRSAQAGPDVLGREETRQPRTGPPARRVPPPGTRTRVTSASNTVRDARTEPGHTPAQC